MSATASADPVDDYVRSQLAVRHLPGVALAVIKDGRIVKSAGYGVASLELEVPVSVNTVFEIGSISKQFAANAVLLLVEDGKVNLDDPISAYLTNSPPAWSAITIRHILTHTSGLPDFDTGNIGFSYRREYTDDVAARLSPAIRERIAAALRGATAFEWLGEESLGPRHFNADPRMTRVSWFRARTADGIVYFTVRLADDGTVGGVLVER